MGRRGACVREEGRGGGKYAIKTVGSGRGKYRQVEWRQMFKDGAFNKHTGDKLTRTVRSTERMQEKARGEAEAKYGEVLRKTKRELERACKLQQDSEQQACKLQQDNPYPHPNPNPTLTLSLTQP